MYLLDHVAVGTVEKNEEKINKYWYSSMGGCVWFELFSVVKSLQEPSSRS